MMFLTMYNLVNVRLTSNRASHSYQNPTLLGLITNNNVNNYDR